MTTDEDIAGELKPCPVGCDVLLERVAHTATVRIVCHKCGLSAPEATWNNLARTPKPVQVEGVEQTCRWEARPSRYGRPLEWFTACGVSTEVFNSCASFCYFCGKHLATSPTPEPQPSPPAAAINSAYDHDFDDPEDGTDRCAGIYRILNCGLPKNDPVHQPPAAAQRGCRECAATDRHYWDCPLGANESPVLDSERMVEEVRCSRCGEQITREADGELWEHVANGNIYCPNDDSGCSIATPIGPHVTKCEFPVHPPPPPETHEFTPYPNHSAKFFLCSVCERSKDAGQHKCDGNHAGPRCNDPECWNDDGDPKEPLLDQVTFDNLMHYLGSYDGIDKYTVGMVIGRVRKFIRAAAIAPTSRIWGELLLDDKGEAHFICHTKDDDFLATKIALGKFIELLQRQVTNEAECPFFTATPTVERQALARAWDIAFEGTFVPRSAWPNDPEQRPDGFSDMPSYFEKFVAALGTVEDAEATRSTHWYFREEDIVCD